MYGGVSGWPSALLHLSAGAIVKADDTSMILAERVISIGGSAGGIQAVAALLACLPTNFPAAILVVIHTSEDSPGLLPHIFSRQSRLPVVPAGELPLEASKVYVAIPGKHLTVTPGELHITDGPRENRNRPAIDPMLCSVAKAYAERAIGVVLSGYLDDGTAGLAAIKYHGGIVVVQDPEDAQAPSMPLSAMANVEVDHVVTLDQLPGLLVRLVAAPAPPGLGRLALDTEATDRIVPSLYACPECRGILFEVYSAAALHFECGLGHAYSSESMLVGQTEASERALWAALRSLEEGVQLARRMMQRAVEMKQPHGAERFRQRAEASERHIQVLHGMLSHRPVDEPSQDEPDPKQVIAS